MKDRRHQIYKHTLLIDCEVNGRVYKAGMKYYGQAIDAKGRWGKYGSGYLRKYKNGKYNQFIFAMAILDCGWENFSHEILFYNLTEDEANDLEYKLITRHQTNNKEFGFNILCGGDIRTGEQSPNYKHGRTCIGKEDKNYELERERRKYAENPEPRKERVQKRRLFLKDKFNNKEIEFKPTSKYTPVRRVGFDEEFFSPCDAAWALWLKEAMFDGSNIAQSAKAYANGKKRLCGGWQWEFIYN